jgi:hypothetical protein
VWRDTKGINRWEPVVQNLDPKSARVVLGGLTVINLYSSTVNDRLGVAITTRFENYRKYKSYEATGKRRIIPR